MSLLTAARLRELRACADQLAEFERRFGESVDITEELCLSVAGVFGWNWAADKLLTPAARAEYERDTATALAEYERVRATAWAEYGRVRPTAWAKYDLVMAPARAEYERVKALAFARAYIGGAS